MTMFGVVAVVATSPPARGRGLKREKEWFDNVYIDVAPRAGAWIETGGLRCNL